MVEIVTGALWGLGVTLGVGLGVLIWVVICILIIGIIQSTI